MAAIKATRNVLMLVAHTGGGHLRAAQAVTEALRRRYGSAVSVEILDALGQYAPFPFNHLDTFYPRWINRAATTWEWGYRLTDGPWRATAVLRVFWPLVWPRVKRLLLRHPAHVIVSLHPLTNHYFVWGVRRLAWSTPILTMVTDPVSVHPFWLSPDVDRCLLGSVEAQHKALECGVARSQLRVTGLPVNPCFVEGLLDRAQARRVLNWPSEQATVLMIGGGEGMGRLYQTARAIDAACPDVRLVVVAGRNRRLRQRLAEADWRIPVKIHGFVHHTREMPILMSAADLLITKAGPSTLHEAFLAGLPLILIGAIPGQEEGNVRLVVEAGAGVWAPDPSYAAALVARWTQSKHDALARLATCSRGLACPDAAVSVSEEVWQLALTNL